MSAQRMAALAGAFVVWTVAACEQAGPSVSTPAPTASGDRPPEARREDARAQPSLKDLGPSARRVKVIVLPGDATVEVNGIPVRRRNGIVELLGKVGESYRLRVTKGASHLEQDVTIQDSAASPPALDLDHPPVGRSAGPGGPGPAGSAAPAAPTANPMLPENFQ